MLINKQQQPLVILRDALYSDPIRVVVQKNIAAIGSLAEHFLQLQLQTTGALP
jgi:hypothetical protein